MREAASAAVRYGRAGILVAALLAAAAPASAQTSDLVNRATLRVCADPADMPLSNQKGEGFENKLAELLAKDLDLPLVYTWFPQVTGWYRNTLGAKRCDVIMGFVAVQDPVQNSNPYYTSAFILIHNQGSELEGVDRLDDPKLKDKRIGVIAGTAPASVMAMNGLIGKAKPYALMVDRRYDSPAEQMIADIISGQIDAGILWGPIGGYFAKHAGKPLTVVPLVKETKGPPMTYRMTLATRPGELNWKHRLNAFIDENQAEINGILLEYGVPLLDGRNRPITAAGNNP